MAELDFRSASALLFDPVGPNVLATRSILTQIGFTRVDMVREYKSLAHQLTQEAYDLIVLEVTDAGGDMRQLVRRLRAGEVGVHPFPIVILTSWDRASGAVRSLIDAGSDDLLLRPFSPNALHERIISFAKRRKPFVVTGDYIGPDRRSDDSRPSDTPLFDAPNSLKAVASGDPEALKAHHEALRAARTELDRERLRRLAMRISAAAHMRLGVGPESDGMSLDELSEAARELHHRVRRHGRSEPVEIAAALSQLIGQMKEAGVADQGQLELMRDLPLGVYAALEGDKSADRIRGEVDAVLKRVRERYGRGDAPAKAAAAG